MDVDSDRTDPANPPTGTGHVPGADPPTAPAAAPHLVTVLEKGSFSTAHCSCGWRSPARRSRDKARKDAAEHTERETAPQPEHESAPRAG